MKPIYMAVMLMTVPFLAACSGATAPAADGPFALIEASVTSGPDTDQVVKVAHPETGEQVGEIRWEALEYRIVLRNESDTTLTGLETRLVPSDAIRNLYGGSGPFAESSGGSQNYGHLQFGLEPAKELEVRRSIITYAHETEYARNVESPLTPEEAERLLEVADQVTLEVRWDGGSQQIDLSGMAVETAPRPGPPILTGAQAVEAAVKLASFSRPELGEGEKVRNPRARLMTLQEYEDRFTRGRSYRDRSRPVWVVQVEGEWQDAGIVPPESRKTYTHGVMVLDAHTGQQVTGAFRFEPLSLEEAEGLDPGAYARYPLEVSLAYAKDFVDFPVSEPGNLPEGYSLTRITLALAHPMQEALPYSRSPNQTVVLHYTSSDGNELQVAQSLVGRPDLIENAQPTTVQGAEAWTSHESSEATWLAWRATYPKPDGSVTYVTYFLYSADGAVTPDEMRQVAESLPEGKPPLPTSTPVRRPTLTTTPTSCSPEIKEPPCGSGADMGRSYPYQLYTHCGIRWAYFGGRWWEARPPLDDGSGNPPREWGNPFDMGTMELVNQSLARFTSRGGKAAEFKPLPVERQEYPGEPCA